MTTHGLADVLLVGLSTRALADSALLGGFETSSVDFYGDLDQKGRLPNVALGRDLAEAYSAAAAVRAAARVQARRVAYAADLENAPAAVQRLMAERELLGNPPEVLTRVRDPEIFFSTLRQAGIPTPLTLAPARDGAAPPRHRGVRWVVKPLASGGGRGIRLLEEGARHDLPDGAILQEYLEGPALSFLFLAAGGEVRPLALNLQLEERASFGAAPFAHVGSLTCLPSALDESSVREQALRAAVALTRTCGLRGWNGMDFVVRRGEVVPLEVNPRQTSSMELWDEPREPLFGAHVEACRGRLATDAWLPRPAETRGKALVFARREVTVGDSTQWLGWDEEHVRSTTSHVGKGDPARVWPRWPVADIPFPGERIPAGQPICTVFAAARDPQECLAGLAALAARVEEECDVSPLDDRSRALPDLESRGLNR